jgi:hypothetical protein
MAATQHYAIQPKSDLILLYGIRIFRGWVGLPGVETPGYGLTSLRDDSAFGER